MTSGFRTKLTASTYVHTFEMRWLSTRADPEPFCSLVCDLENGMDLSLKLPGWGSFMHPIVDIAQQGTQALIPELRALAGARTTEHSQPTFAQTLESAQVLTYPARYRA